MYQVWILLRDFVTNNQDGYQLNIGLLIAVLLMIMMAHVICLIIMKHNHLYNKPDLKRKSQPKGTPQLGSIPLKVNTNNEVA